VPTSLRFEIILGAGRVHRGRVGYWRLFWGTLIRRPRQFPHAIELAILGYHFRRMANSLRAPSSRKR